MTKKQYLDKNYNAMHELMTLFRACFPEETRAGTISITFSDRYSLNPNMSTMQIYVHDKDTSDILTKYDMIVSDETRYTQNEEVI